MDAEQVDVAPISGDYCVRDALRVEGVDVPEATRAKVELGRRREGAILVDADRLDTAVDHRGH